MAKPLKTKKQFLTEAKPIIVDLIKQGKSQEEITKQIKQMLAAEPALLRELGNLDRGVEQNIIDAGRTGGTSIGQQLDDVLGRISAGIAPGKVQEGIAKATTPRDPNRPSEAATEIPKTPEDIQAELEAAAQAAQDPLDSAANQFAQLRGLPPPTDDEIKEARKAKGLPTEQFLSVPSRSIFESIVGTMSGAGATIDFANEDEKRFLQLRALAGITEELLFLSGGMPAKRVVEKGVTQMMHGTGRASFEAGVNKAMNSPMMRGLIENNKFVRSLFTFLGGELPEKITRRAVGGAALAAPLGFLEALQDEPQRARREGREAEPAKAFMEMLAGFALFELGLGAASHLTAGIRADIKAGLERTAGEFMRKRMEALFKGRLGEVSVDEMMTVAEGSGEAAGQSLKETMEYEFLDNFRQELGGRILPILKQAQDVEGANNPYVAAFWRGVMRGSGDESTITAITEMQARFDLRLARRRGRFHPGQGRKIEAPATFIGEQERGRGRPPFKLFNLTEEIPGHPKGSTVSDITLEEMGYIVPNPNLPKPTTRGKTVGGRTRKGKTKGSTPPSSETLQAEDAIAVADGEIAALEAEIAEIQAVGALPVKEARTEIGRRRARISAAKRNKSQAMQTARKGGSPLTNNQIRSDESVGKRVTDAITRGEKPRAVLDREAAAISETRGATLEQINTLSLEDLALQLANQINPEAGQVFKGALEASVGADVKLRAREIVRARIRARGGPQTEAERRAFFPQTSRAELIRQSRARTQARAEATQTKPTVSNKEIETAVSESFIPPRDEPPAKLDALDNLFDDLGGLNAFDDTSFQKMVAAASEKEAQIAKPLVARRTVRKRTTAPSLQEVREEAGAQGLRLRSIEEPQKLSDDLSKLHPFEEKVVAAQEAAANAQHELSVVRGVEGAGRKVKKLESELESAQTLLSIARKRNEERLGRGGKDALRPNPSKTSAHREIIVEDANGETVAKFTSTKDALAYLKEHGSTASAFIAEAAAQSIDDHPDDTPEERQINAALRSALRVGGIGAILTRKKALSRGASRVWNSFRTRVGAFVDRGFDSNFLQSPAFESTKRTFQDIETSFWSRIYLSMRGSEEMIRNWPEELRLPVQRFFSAERQLNKAWETVRRGQLDWNRLNVSAGSKASERVGALMDVIPSAILRLLPHELEAKQVQSVIREETKKKWRWALQQGIKVNKPRDKQLKLAIDAIENAEGQELFVAKDMTEKFITLRAQEIEATKAKIESEIKVGFKAPIVIKDAQGGFVRRVKTDAQAKRLIAKAAKKGDEWTSEFATEALPEEVIDRVGPTLTTYLPRIIYDSLRDRYNIEGLVAEAPWADPIVMLREFKRLNGLSGKTRREAFEEAFGPNLTKEERLDLYETVRAAMSDARAQTDRFTTLSVPREVYVKFYKNRIAKNDDYSRDAVKLYNTYSSTVLRDIHVGPKLPELVEGLQAAKLKGQNEHVIDMLIRNIDFVMGRDQPFSIGANRAIGRLTGMAYGASLWGRVSPAFNNIIGQMWLVGLPEMGVDSSLAGLVAMSSPAVRQTLARRQMVWQALPLQERDVIDALRVLRTARTPKEARGALADAGIRALDLLSLSESFIRQWAFLGGLANELKQMGVIRGNFPGGPISPKGSGVKGMLDFFKEGGAIDQLPKEQLEKAFLGAERNVGKVAFWFNPASQPLLMRKIKNFPGGGMVTMFMNFPVNYSNRFMSILADATAPIFGNKLPRGQVQAAWGKIIRHIGALYLIGGPASLPIVNEMINEVSDMSPTMGAEFRKRIEPYQNWWARYFAGAPFLQPGVLAEGPRGGDPGINVPFTDVPIPGAPNIFRDVDKERFSTLTPLKDLAAPLTEIAGIERTGRSPSPPLSLIREGVQAGRGQLARLSAGIASKLYDTNIEIDPALEELILKDEQKFFGMLSPFVDVPQPEGYQLPSVINRLIVGGGTLQDMLNFAYANRAVKEGLPGPLSPQHRMKPLENPLQRMFFSSTEQAAADRRDVDALGAYEKQNKRIVDDFLNSQFNPLVSPRERTRAQNRFLAHEELFERGYSKEALQRTLDEQTMTPAERKLSNASMATIQRVLPDLFERTDPDRLAHSTAEQRDRTLRLLTIALKRQQEFVDRQKAKKKARGR